MPVAHRLSGIISLCVLAALPVRAGEARSASPSAPLEARAKAGSPAPVRVWVYFTDHGESSGADLRDMLSRAQIPERALSRRARRTSRPRADVHDLPVNELYVRGVRGAGADIRHRSRYLNAVSAWVAADRLHALAGLPYVRHVVRVRTGRCDAREINKELPEGPSNVCGPEEIDYGLSDAQHEMINTKPLHAAGYTGRGVRIAVLDTGFFLSHDALAHLDVVAEWDFINDDGITADEPEDVEGQMWHGTQSLGIIASNWPGSVMGTAWDAEFVLAKTERLLEELQIEEDDFVAALEWADELGVDVVSSSLGYYYWYDYEDMDGNTAVTTIAADIAVSRGIVVVTSAGNEGGFPWPTLNAPADADSVITVGAVELSGTIIASSSRGPTYDGRIKPDVVAQGRLVATLNWQYASGPAAAAGTSASAPLVAGAAALLLQKHPCWSPMQVRDALRETASQADTPNNNYGWGIIDAFAAAQYAPTMSVDVDIRPGSCQNPFNPKSRGVLPVLVLGSAELDVRDVDVATLRLSGAAALRAKVIDMAGAGGCESQSPDGFADLLVKFDSEAIAAAVTRATKGGDVMLELTGELHNGTHIAGEDGVRIVGKDGRPALTGNAEADVVTGLGPAIPNPFNPTTRIAYAVAQQSHVELKIYDARGRLVATLVDGTRPAGKHEVAWNAAAQASGVYFCRLRAGVINETRRLVLLK